MRMKRFIIFLLAFVLLSGMCDPSSNVENANPNAIPSRIISTRGMAYAEGNGENPAGNRLNQLFKLRLEKASGDDPAAADASESVNTLQGLFDVLALFGSDSGNLSIEQIAEKLLDGVIVENGLDVRAANRCLDLLEGLIPSLGGLVDRLGNPDSDGTGYIAALQSMLDIYENHHEYIDLIRAILGDGSDRTYLVAAQNSAELYAAGGFPGAMGLVTIRNGILRIGEFEERHVLLGENGSLGDHESLTDEVRSIFPGLIEWEERGESVYSWDAGYIPDFERVAQIWYGSYCGAHENDLDGIFALTPMIIGKMMPFAGNIELSEGTVLTADNATAFLQHEIYVKYLNTQGRARRDNNYVDELFSEVARKVMDALAENFRVSMLPDFVEMLKEAINERILMMWFRNEDAQDIARAAKCSGGLSHDPNAPQIGLFASLEGAGKMGWWIDIDYTLSEPTLNADGSRSYALTARFTNAMLNEEKGNYSEYISHGKLGIARVQALITGPAGGRIENADASGMTIMNTTYQGLPLFTARNMLSPEQEMVMRCTVTTAPGVDAEPEIIRTPTLTEARLAYLESNG